MKKIMDERRKDMAKEKKVLGRPDSDGNVMVMRGVDYVSDFCGQFGLGLMANLVGQLTYFYTDKVGLAVGGVGIVMLIAKIIDAFTDVIFGNIFDHVKGGNEKYYKWFMRLALPAPLLVFLMFTVPKQNMVGLGYALVTNILLTAVLYSAIGCPFGAVMIVKTRSQKERSSMGLTRAIANYSSGMIVAIATIPVTNMLGGTQNAWIKYGIIIALIVLLVFFTCYSIGKSSKFADDFTESRDSVPAEDMQDAVKSEDEAVELPQALAMLFKNKYWVIVLLFNLITSITSGMAGASGTYYCKWIFGNDNLVAILGAAGLLGTVIGFAISKPVINKFGIRGTVQIGLMGAAITAGLRCVAPTSYVLYAATSIIGSFVQIPLMSLYAVLTGMAVDYNEYKYDKRLVNTAGGAIGFGSKVGNGLSSVIITGFLAVGGYESTLAVATDSMRYAIYGFSNYLPLIINLVMFVIFMGFDLEKKLPGMLKEIQERRAKENGTV